MLLISGNGNIVRSGNRGHKAVDMKRSGHI